MSEGPELIEISGTLVLTSPAAKKLCRELMASGLLLEQLSSLFEAKANNKMSEELQMLMVELQSFRASINAGQFNGAPPMINSGAPVLHSGEVSEEIIPEVKVSAPKSAPKGGARDMISRMRKMKN